MAREVAWAVAPLLYGSDRNSSLQLLQMARDGASVADMAAFLGEVAPGIATRLPQLIAHNRQRIAHARRRLEALHRRQRDLEDDDDEDNSGSEVDNGGETMEWTHISPPSEELSTPV